MAEPSYEEPLLEELVLQNFQVICGTSGDKEDSEGDDEGETEE